MAWHRLHTLFYRSNIEVDVTFFKFRLPLVYNGEMCRYREIRVWHLFLLQMDLCIFLWKYNHTYLRI